MTEPADSENPSVGLPSRREFLKLAAITGMATAVFAPPRGEAAPVVTGDAHPALAPFDELMTGFVSRSGAPGASLAVTRAGKLVYARGFGLAEPGRPVEPDSLFRIASVSKPLTAVAILRLASQNKVRLDGPVLEVVKLQLPLTAGVRLDSRWRAVTIRELLRHTGGMDRDVSGDPIGMARRISRAVGRPLPVGPEEVVRFSLGRPLDFDPGTRHAYSNVGYLLLGRAIEAAGGKSYEDYVREEVLAPLGIREMRLGRASPDGRLPKEVRYHDPKNRTGPAVCGPRIGETVPLPYGAENFDAFEAHGGWVASAVDLMRFASAFDDPDRCPVLSREAIDAMWQRPEGSAGHEADGRPKDAYYGCGWQVRPIGRRGANTWHTGLVAGTSSLLVRRSDGLDWAVLFNTHQTPDGQVLAGLIDPLVHRAADAVRAWPKIDLFPKFTVEA